MEIRQAKGEDLYSVKSIWESSFEDDGKYFDFYTKHAYHPEWTWLVFDGNIAVSMMTVLPCFAWVNGKEKKGSYIYAVATLPEYRHRGIMTMLHEKVEQICRCNADAFLTLVPARTSLFAMYEKLRYTTCSWLYNSRFKLDELKQSTVHTTFSQVNENEFVSLRHAYLKNFACSAALAVNNFSYTFQELFAAGYSICLANNKFFKGYLVYRLDENKQLLIRETNLSKESFDKMIYSFADKIGAASLLVKTAMPWKSDAEKFSYSMMKHFDVEDENKQYYMNLMLDD